MIHVFLLMGQSNMSGRGGLGDVPELTHPDVWMFRGGGWIPAEEPLHTDKPGMAGVGLGMSFAVELGKRTGMAPIGLVPCAVGGSPLQRWMPGADLYGKAVRTARDAMANGTLRGVLWHQGEADSGNRENAERYGERFGDMIRRLRSDLSAESVPVIAGELGPFMRNRDGEDFHDLVNARLRELETRLPRFGCVDADGMTDNGDSLHFDAASLREFGIRYAKRFMEITD